MKRRRKKGEGGGDQEKKKGGRKEGEEGGVFQNRGQFECLHPEILAGKMVQQLRAFATLTEDPGSLPSTHI